MPRHSMAALVLFVALALAGCETLSAVGGTDTLVQLLTSQLGVTQNQATGGVGSILSLAKEKLSGVNFSTLANLIPGADQFMKRAQDLGAVTGPVGDQTGLAAAFSRLGMGSDMVGKFGQVLSDFVGKTGGEPARNLLASVLQ